MGTINQLVANLTFPQNKVAYAAMKELEALSKQSDQVYPYFETFLSMLDDPNSYVRSRGIILLAQNARWDREGKLDWAIDAYLVHITDEKPITARRCIQSLKLILDAKPELGMKIRTALEQADFSGYPDSMSPLLEKDRLAILKQINRSSHER